jgi:glycosyltransferase involved in cell wall biosynthesis
VRVLQVISSVAVNLGGVVEGVRLFSEEWKQAGHTVEIASMDPPGFHDAQAFPVPVHTLGPAYTKWAFSRALYPWLCAHRHEYDVIIIHGLWQYHTFACWLALHGHGTPYVAFTHGMLDPYFKRRYPFKHLKKWMVWPWSDYRMLRDAKAVMFTCQEEMALASQSFWLYDGNGIVVGLGTRTSPFPLDEARESFLGRFPHLRGKRLLTFVGRLNPKKACDILIEAFASTLGKSSSWHLVLAGPDSDGWGRELMRIAARLHISDRVTLTGMLQGEQKWGAIAASEVLTLPSHQENFGVVVAEALACGVPVIISDQVNIWREIESGECGFVTKDTRSGIEKALLRWENLSDGERTAVRDRCFPCFQKHFDIQAVSIGLMETLQALGHTPTSSEAAV